MREDSNPRSPQGDAGFQDRDFKPLRHSSQTFSHKTHASFGRLWLSHHRKFAFFDVFFCFFFYKINKIEKRTSKKKQRKHQKVFPFWRRPGSNRSLHACKACVLPTKLRPRREDNFFCSTSTLSHRFSTK